MLYIAADGAAFTDPFGYLPSQVSGCRAEALRTNIGHYFWVLDYAGPALPQRQEAVQAENKKDYARQVSGDCYEALPAVRKGRPPSEMAVSHGVIMDAVYALLQEKSVRDLTMEAVAKRAGVGKPTLYKWWPTKATLVLAMLCERMAPKLEKPTVLRAEESLRLRMRSLIDAFN